MDCNHEDGRGVHPDDDDIDCDDRTTRVPELLVEQIEAADVVLINKIDLAGPDRVRTASSLAQSLNGEAEMVTVRYGCMPTTTLLSEARREKRAPGREEGDDDESSRSSASGSVDDIGDMSLEELNDLMADTPTPA